MRVPQVVVVVAAILAAIALGYTLVNLGINTSTEEMISADVKFRRDRSAYVRAFPEFRETVVAVVEGAAPERVEQAAADLAAALRADGANFAAVDYPAGDPFFAAHGLLYLEPDELAEPDRSPGRGAAPAGRAGRRSEPARARGLRRPRARGAERRRGAAGGARPPARRDGRCGRGAARRPPGRGVLAADAAGRRSRRSGPAARGRPAALRSGVAGARGPCDRGAARARPRAGDRRLRMVSSSG